MPRAAVRAYYGADAWKPEKVILAKNIIRSSGVGFDSFAVRGVSGMVFGSKLAHLMRKNLVVVRKRYETSHSDNEVEGARPMRYVFVDDFVSTGKTRTAVWDAIRRTFPSAVQVATYLYGHDEFLVLQAEMPPKGKLPAWTI